MQTGRGMRSSETPYFNDALGSTSDDGYGQWPEDPFSSDVVQAVLAVIRSLDANTGKPAGTSFEEIGQRAGTQMLYRRHGVVYGSDPVPNVSQETLVWALRNLIASGQVVHIHERVPQEDIDHPFRGEWVELFCPTADETEVRTYLRLPPRVPLSARRPRATLALSDTRAAIWAMTDGHCWYCGVKTNPFDDFCIDHVRPVALGGADELENLVPCCTRCNRDKSKLTLEAFRALRARWVGLEPVNYAFYFERMGYQP